MRKLWLLALAVPLVVFSAIGAEAVPVCNNGTYQDLLDAGSCKIGDKIFSGFTLGGDLGADEVDVTVRNDGTNYGFLFGFDLSVIGGQGAVSSADLQITYSVATEGNVPRITDVTVGQTSFTTGSAAFAAVSEDICIGGTFPACNPGTFVTLDTDDDNPIARIDFDPVSVVGLKKDIVVAAGCPEGLTCTLSFSSISLLENTVSQTPVPEPATLLLIGSGLVGVATWSRRKLRK